MGRVAGICYIKVDGQQLDVVGGIEAPLMPVKRETVMAASGPAGFKEEATEPYIKLSAVFAPTFPMDAVRNGTNMTVTAEWPNGKAYTLSGAYVVDEATVKSEDGTVDLKFGGNEGIWQ